VTCFFLYRGRDTRYLGSGWNCHWYLACQRSLLLRCAASERRREGDTWSNEIWGLPSRRRFGCSLRFLLLQLLRVPAAPVIGGMGFLALHKLAVTADWSGESVLLLWTLFVQVAAPAPQITGRLLTVCPDVAELLAVMALRKAVLSSVCLHLDCNVAEGCQSEDLLGLCRSWQGNEE
jgi:hypothetical protein